MTAITLPPDITSPPDAGLLRLFPDARAICRFGDRQVVDWQGHVYIWCDDGTHRVSYDQDAVRALAELAARRADGLVAAGREEALEGNGHANSE